MGGHQRGDQGVGSPLTPTPGRDAPAPGACGDGDGPGPLPCSFPLARLSCSAASHLPPHLLPPPTYSHPPTTQNCRHSRWPLPEGRQARRDVPRSRALRSGSCRDSPTGNLLVVYILDDLSRDAGLMKADGLLVWSPSTPKGAPQAFGRGRGWWGARSPRFPPPPLTLNLPSHMCTHRTLGWPQPSSVWPGPAPCPPREPLPRKHPWGNSSCVPSAHGCAAAGQLPTCSLGADGGASRLELSHSRAPGVFAHDLW